MSLSKAIHHLNTILSGPRRALQDLLARSNRSTLSLFWRLHLPLALLFPLSSLATPYSHTLKYFPWGHVFLPFFLLCFFLFFAAIYDRISRHSNPKLKISVFPNQDNSNIAFYFHLPVAGVGPFFFFHPTLGYVMLFIAELWSTLYSIEYLAATQEISRARSLTYWIMSIIFILIPLAALLLFFSLLRSIEEFRQLS